MTINLKALQAWLVHSVAPFVATYAGLLTATNVNNDRSVVVAAAVAAATTVLHALQGSVKKPA